MAWYWHFRSVNKPYIITWIYAEKYSTTILLWRIYLVEYFLSKGFVILEHNSKNLSSAPNEVKQTINVINIHKSEFVMDCYTKIPFVANTTNKLHMIYNLNSGYIHNFYHDKKEIIDELFCQHIEPLLKDINHLYLFI